MTQPRVVELQGDDIANAPKVTGIYAWYYRPRVFYGSDKAGVTTAIGQFMNTRTRLEAEVRIRYGLRLTGGADLDTLYGADQVPAAALIANAIDGAGDFIRYFIQGMMTPVFAKPLYIGIAKTLFERVYKNHYSDLCAYWEPSSSVSRYLASHPGATVQAVMDDLGITHSFAVEARVRSLAPRDLVVYVCPTGDMVKIDPKADAEAGDDPPLLRSLEQVLQLLADPICGRR